MKTTNIKVRLKVDLTRYNSILVAGIEGVMVSPVLSDDTMVNCRFQGLFIPIVQ